MTRRRLDGTKVRPGKIEFGDRDDGGVPLGVEDFIEVVVASFGFTGEVDGGDINSIQFGVFSSQLRGR